MTSIARRTFLKKSSYAGLASIMGASIFPGNLFGMYGGADRYQKKARKPVCHVKKEIYVPYTQPRKAPITTMSYTSRGLRREEFRSYMQSSDWNEAVMKRTSDDNGRTWSDWVEEPKQAQTNEEFTQSGGAFQNGSVTFDPVSGQLIKPVFHRLFKGTPQVALKEIWKGNRLFWDHGFYQLSGDDGKTWGVNHQLKYEDGPDFDPSDWGKQEFLKTNEMYIGNSIVLKNGSLLISATIPVPYHDKEDEKNPSIFPNNYREGCVAGAICFIGKWNPQKMDYDWKKSKPLFLPRHLSTRGLTELDVSELTNGKLLIIMRGSNAKLDITKSPGRKWFSVSGDGGFTWDDVTDMKYDDGEQFYSSATISKTIRSSKTGKLYWVGNINNEPPKGNLPRYPLQIVEIDEKGPSFRKESVTVIDDRDPIHDSEFLQLSNFSLLEDRETKNLEIFLTRLGENGGGDDTWTANSYKYTLILK